MKIAYLITAYNNFKHLERLILALNHKKDSFFIHIDKKAPKPFKIAAYSNVTMIPRMPIWWGGWSHLEAILRLMRESVKLDFDYYILISGTDYPIRPNKFLYEKLKQGSQFINIITGFQPHKPEWRVKHYHLDGFDRRNTKSIKTKIYKFIEDQLKNFITKKKYPFSSIYHGSTWWALNSECISYILDYIDNNPKYVKFFKTCWCPEEAFIPTIIGNSKFLQDCKGNLTFADWSTSPAPAIINEEHLELFKNQFVFTSSYGNYEPFFARKFHDGNHSILDLIDSQLRID